MLVTEATVNFDPARKAREERGGERVEEEVEVGQDGLTDSYA